MSTADQKRIATLETQVANLSQSLNDLRLSTQTRNQELGQQLSSLRAAVSTLSQQVDALRGGRVARAAQPFSFQDGQVTLNEALVEQAHVTSALNIEPGGVGGGEHAVYVNGIMPAGLTPEEQAQVELEYYAANCPITLSEFRGMCESVDGARLLEGYVEFCWEYAKLMQDQALKAKQDAELFNLGMPS